MSFRVVLALWSFCFVVHCSAVRLHRVPARPGTVVLSDIFDCDLIYEVAHTTGTKMCSVILEHFLLSL